LKDKKELLKHAKNLRRPMKISLKFKLKLLLKRRKRREELKNMLPKEMLLNILKRLKKKKDSDKSKAFVKSLLMPKLLN